MFVKTNREIRLTDSNVESFNLLPNGYYLVKYDSRNNQYFLEETDDFKIPDKVYGDSEYLSDRYVKSFNQTDKNMGILLTGLKGTGKSLTAKLTAIKSNLPVILVTEEFTGEEFKSFLNSIKQVVVIFIDEFEKVYTETETQDSLLSLLDGVFEGKKLFIFTSNMVNRINQYMLNRPGRIRYLAEYESLSDETISDVVDDSLINKVYREELLNILDIIGNISMDILVSLINEINLYDESPKDVIKFLNIRPEDSQYSVSIIEDGIKIGTTSLKIHPLRISDVYVEFLNTNTKQWDDIKIVATEWEKIKEGKTVTMKKDNTVLYFEPSEKQRLVF